MPTWNHLGTWELDLYRQAEAFRKRVRGAKTPKLERWAEGLRRSLSSYEADRYERRDPRTFLEAWDQAREAHRVIAAEIRIRQLGPDGPFR